MRRLLVSVLLVAAFGLFLLIPEEPYGVWLDEPDEVPEPSLQALPDELQAAGPRQTLTGHVRLASGEPVSGVTVRLEHAWVPEVSATSDGQGRFELTPEEPRGELVLDDPRWFLLGGELAVSASRSEGYLLAVAPPVSVQGRVVDALGQPVDGAELWARSPPGVLVPLGISSLPVQEPSQSARSGRAGRFHLGPLPDVPGLEIEVSAEGFLPASVPLPAPGSGELVIALRPAPG